MFNPNTQENKAVDGHPELHSETLVGSKERRQGGGREGGRKGGREATTRWGGGHRGIIGKCLFIKTEQFP